MSEFTKGPWSIEHSRMSNGILEEDEAISICTDDSHCWDICAVWKDIPIGDEKANAHLIAAAPDNYHANKMVKDKLPSTPNTFGGGYSITLNQEEVDEITEALAKARGEL